MLTNGIKLSIAIPSWNTKELLDQCLASVFRSLGDLSAEVIVVDNASEDGSAEMAEAKYPEVQLIRNQVNIGFAGACNLAFKQSIGKYFLLLNSDTIVIGKAFQELADFMERHPDAGAAGCKLLNADGSLQRSCSSFPGLASELFDALYLSKIFPKSRIFGGYAMTYWNFDTTREVDFAGGSCLILRREAIEEVGLLDEGFFMYTEEADWCYRLWFYGWKVFYYPGAEVIHLGGQSAKKYGNDILLHLYYSRNRFIMKHHGRVIAAAHRLIIALGAFVRVFAFGTKFAFTLKDREAVAFHYKLFKWAIGFSRREKSHENRD